MTSKIWMFVLQLVVLLVTTTQGARILAIQPLPIRSHMMVFSSLTQELARRGHEVVVLSPFPLKEPMANYTDIDVSYITNQYANNIQTNIYEMSSALGLPLKLWAYTSGITEEIFKMPEMKTLIQDKTGFNLVLIETFYNEALFAIAEHFRAPLVVLCPFVGYSDIHRITGNPLQLSYIPHTALAFSGQMNLFKRTANVFYTKMWDAAHYIFHLSRQEAIRSEIFGNEGPTVYQLQSYPSIVLLNSHPAVSHPRSLMPNMIEVGGMHVRYSHHRELPRDIQKYLDDAHYGAIYFSMGSNLRGDRLSPEKRDAILAAFSELPQSVLWKYESETLPSSVHNVKISSWLPQQEVLAHPNIRLFITHGGMLSIQESIFHGVPVIGIPIYGDQAFNMRVAEGAGYGIYIDFANITKDTMLWAMKRVLYDPSYRTEARKRALVFRDQPNPPLNRATYWIEYCMRHNGAPHLRSAATNLSWFQLWQIDVMLLSVATLYISFRITKRFLVICIEFFKRCLPRRPVERPKTN